MSSTLAGAALTVVMALEQLTGMPIVIAEREVDIQKFWDATATALCEKTGDNFCSESVQFIKDSTAAEGFSTILEYVGDDESRKLACIVLPPSPDLSSSDVAYEMADGSLFGYSDLPAKNKLDAWLTMHWAARCLDRDGSFQEEARADAFAAMAVALIQGDPEFTRYPLETPARKFAFIRNQSTTEAAVDLAERHMLDLWKPEAATALRSQSCNASATPSQDRRVSRIQRDVELPTCASEQEGGQFGSSIPGLPGGYAGGPSVSVTDANLHLWMYGEPRDQQFAKERLHGEANPTTGAPPTVWHPFKGFSSTQAAVEFMWREASSLTGVAP